MKTILTAALLATISLAPALAADTAKTDAAPAKDAPSAKPAKEEKLICTKEAQVGSIISRRVCRTPTQIEADRETARRTDEERRNSGSLRLTPGASVAQ